MEIMEKIMKQHNITKIILKNNCIRDYYCNDCNTSYPSLESVTVDHPNLDTSQINSFYKDGHGVTSTTTENEKQTPAKEYDSVESMDMIHNE